MFVTLKGLNKLKGQSCKFAAFLRKFMPTFQKLIFSYNTDEMVTLALQENC